MKTTLQFLGLNIHSSWYRMLDQYLDYWQRLVTVTAAEVVMERQSQGKPAYRVQVRLDIPDDILQAETTAQSIKAALLLVNRDLEAQIHVRKARRIARRASHRHTEPMSDGGFADQPSISAADAPGRLAVESMLPSTRAV